MKNHGGIGEATHVRFRKRSLCDTAGGTHGKFSEIIFNKMIGFGIFFFGDRRNVGYVLSTRYISYYNKILR